MTDDCSKFGENLKIEYISFPSNHDIEFLTKQINHETIELGSAYPFAFFVRSDADEIIAGCNGSVIFGSIYTDQLWVHPDWRQRGLGRKLMDHVHDYGYKTGCSIATVTTMSFQNGQEFYEKLGYQVDFERKGYVNDSSCLFLQKKLDKPIQLAAYNPDWPKMFETESTNIKEALGDNCIAVHHIGSTSVPRLAAKPKIDIIAVVKPFTQIWSPAQLLQIFERLGYNHRGEFNIPFKYMFTKREGVNKPLSKLAPKEQVLGAYGAQNRSVLNAREDSSTGATTQLPVEVEFGKRFNVNLHVYEENHPEIELALLFRDYLRKNDRVRNEYTILKESILNDPLSSKKQDSMFPVYTLRKNDFILNILKQNGFNRLRFVKCTHYAEMEAAKHLRQKYFFDKVPINDPYIWTFNHTDHVHFILYQGTKIIGYAHVQLWPQARAALRIIVIASAERNQGSGGEFLQLIEKWLKTQGYQTIHTESSPEAIQFYKKYGYDNMPFNDPDNYPSDLSDIPMGKKL